MQERELADSQSDTSGGPRGVKYRGAFKEGVDLTIRRW